VIEWEKTEPRAYRNKSKIDSDATNAAYDGIRDDVSQVSMGPGRYLVHPHSKAPMWCDANARSKLDFESIGNEQSSQFFISGLCWRTTSLFFYMCSLKRNQSFRFRKQQLSVTADGKDHARELKTVILSAKNSSTAAEIHAEFNSQV